MSQKAKVLVSILVAVVLLAAGGAATVMAQEKSVSPREAVSSVLPAKMVAPVMAPGMFFSTISDNITTRGLLARVAEKLGITEEELANAFKQAQQEMREEALVRALERAVEKGRITQEQADEIKAWWQQKPEALGPSLLPGMFGRSGPGGGHMGGGRGGQMRGWYKGQFSDNTTQKN